MMLVNFRESLQRQLLLPLLPLLPHHNHSVCCNHAILLADTRTAAEIAADPTTGTARARPRLPYPDFFECCYEQNKVQPRDVRRFVKAVYGVCMPGFGTLSLVRW